MGYARLPAFTLLIGLSASTYGSDLDDIAKPKETDSKVPTPQVTPTPTQRSLPEVSADGVFSFNAALVSNMEHGNHLLEHGYKAVCVDSQGVVAQARMDIYAVVNGEKAQSGTAYPVVTLRPALEYLRSGATAGTCNLKVCLPSGEAKAGQDFSCDESIKAADVVPDPERPVEYHETNVPYKVMGKDISLTTKSATVSAYHPVFGFAAPAKAFKDYQSPLVINLSGLADFDLIDVWDAKREIRFDLIGDGQPVRTGWIGRKAAFLAMDRNHNRKIDDGTELFGEYTQGAAVRSDGRRWDNGFLALAQYDQNKDGRIDNKDRAYKDLLVWNDKNEDGRSQLGELKTLEQSRIRSIELGYSATGQPENYQTIAGNELRYKSVLVMTNGEKRDIADVWFRQRRFAERSLVTHNP